MRPDGGTRLVGSLRSVSAAVDTLGKPVRPYAFAVPPQIDRFVVTRALMMESSWAEVLQIYRYFDFNLLHTPIISAERGGAQKLEGAGDGVQGARSGGRVGLSEPL